MPEELMPGIGNDWCIQFNDASLASLSGGSARAAFCNNGAASQVWAFRSLYVTLAGAGSSMEASSARQRACSRR